MKRILISLLISVFAVSLLFSVEKKGSVKATKMQKLEKSRLMEPEPSLEAREPSYWNKPYSHSNRNGSTNTVVDSSGNGYGMVVSMTKPIDVTEDGEMVMSYRQYAGAGTTHGQLGTAVSEDGEDWEAYFNVNANGNPPWGGGAGVGNGNETTAQARYPSALASEDYPYALWNEYTGLGNGYGGQLYYSSDEFNWGGGSWTYPALVDLLWDETKDLWTASPDIFYDDDAGMDAVAVSAADWTRSNNYYFRSEFVGDGQIIMGPEQIVIDEPTCLVAGDASGSFNTAPTISMGDDGFGVMGIIGLFPGGDAGTSEISNYHQPIFKITEDYGQTWHGPDADDPCSFYYIGDDLFAEMIATFPQVYTDECEGYDYYIVDFWSYYDFDYKVDANGDIHILMSVVPSDDYYVFWIEGAGWYHFTIDSDYLDNPGQPNTSTGWYFSKVASMQDSWLFVANDGATSIWENQASLSFSKDNPDVVWVALDKKNDYACGEIYDDFGNDDPCDDTYTYDGLSADIYVYKSVDGGATWYDPINATDSMDDPSEYPDAWNGACPNTSLLWCGPEEMYPHAPQWSTEDAMYLMYQMPNWGFNEIGDLLGPDHMNRVYASVIEVTSDTEPGEVDCDLPDFTPGDTNNDDEINVLDIVAIINHILGVVSLDELGMLAGDLNGDSNIDVLDIVAIVNIILGNGRDAAMDATSVKFIKSESGLSMESNGYVGAVEMTLTHDSNFEIKLSANTGIENLYGYNTTGNTTKIVVVTPLDGIFFETSDQFSISEVVVANSNSYVSSEIVDSYAVATNYPNPFNPSTTISYELIGSSNVSISIYNVMGQKIATLVNEFKASGSYSVVWDGMNSNGVEMPSGVYLMKLDTDTNSITNKLSLLR